jgi:transposase InsO family protein
MMWNIIARSIGHGMKATQVPKDFLCVSCAKEKLITNPSYLKVKAESPSFLPRLHGDICGPINPLSGPLRYFMVLKYASIKWSHVCLLSMRNHTFAKFISQTIRLCASFPENRIQSIRMDNAGEFTSKAFNDYCLALGINVEHSIPQVHTQNELAESLIKRIKFIARPLLQDSKLPTRCWGHTILHAAALIQYRPSAYHSASPHQLMRGQQLVVSHLRKFGCVVYVPISPS